METNVSIIIKFCLEEKAQTGKMTQQLGVHSALAEDWIWFSVPTPGSSQPPITLAPGDPMLSSDSLGTCPYMCIPI